VDVERALPVRRYGEAGALTLTVRDDLCDWNDGTFRLETDGATLALPPSAGRQSH